MRHAKPADKARDVPPTLVPEDAKIARVPAPRDDAPDRDAAPSGGAVLQTPATRSVLTVLTQ